MQSTISGRDPIPDPNDPYGGFDEDWWTDRRQRVRALLRALWWTFVPHTYNSPIPKIVTTFLMATWSTVTIGKAFGLAEAGQFYPYMTILVFAIVCTIWGFEMGALNRFTQENVSPVQDRTNDQLNDPENGRNQ